ncbi:hypothetical protein [Streptomyces luteogriseus]|uniref:hypothetical protein n=1 Tax=Streptomyces luteogriseus TaxID=68233 RepID=UPI0037BAF8A0
MKRILTLLGVLLATLLGTFTLAPAASAGDYGCAGSQIDSYPVRTNTSTYGTIFLYYDAATGKNCAVTVSDKGYGTTKPMMVRITRCTQRAYTGACTADGTVQDSGDYQYWAGPRSISADRHCIKVSGAIFFLGKSASGGGIGHCG